MMALSHQILEDFIQTKIISDHVTLPTIQPPLGGPNPTSTKGEHFINEQS